MARVGRTTGRAPKLPRGRLRATEKKEDAKEHTRAKLLGRLKQQRAIRPIKGDESWTREDLYCDK